MKKIFAFLILFSLLAGYTVQPICATDNEIKVFLDGEQLQFDVLPQLIDDRTMVPMRAIFEKLGAEVQWEEETRTVVALKDETVVKCIIGQNMLYLNNSKVEIDVPPCIISGRTLVPVRFVSEALSCRVDWEGDTKTVSIFTDAKGDLNAVSLWEKGGITGTGAHYKSATVLRTKTYLSDDVCMVYAENDYHFNVLVYDDNDNFLGFWNGTEIASSSKFIFYVNVGALDGYNIRLMMKNTRSENITLEESANLHFLNVIQASAFCQPPTLTFIDDDGSLNALQNWEDITDEMGISITSALMTGVMGDATHVSWSEVERLQNKGYEFISHTHKHINLTKSTEEKIVAEFKASIAALNEHGCESRYLVYPYNAINTELMPLVKRYFDAGIGLGSGKTDNTVPLYTYHIRRYSINTDDYVEREFDGQTVSVHAYKSLDTLKDYIDDAIVNGGWVIIMTHLRNDGSFYYDAEVKNTIVELCKYAMDKGVKIQTFGEAFERYQNKEEHGTIYDGTYHIIDCNGVVHYK